VEALAAVLALIGVVKPGMDGLHKIHAGEPFCNPQVVKGLVRGLPQWRFSFQLSGFLAFSPFMPSFDIVSEIERMEIENAVNQAVKELATRFDFKGSSAKIVLTKPELITISAEDGNKLKGIREIIVNKLAKRGVDLRNVDQKDPAFSSIGNATQELVITQGLEGNKAKEITAAIKGEKFKVSASLQDRQVRVTGTKRDELQEVISFLREKDFGVSLSFKNFRD
jgi:hypothetical protein